MTTRVHANEAYHQINDLPPLAEEFKSGDGTQAFANVVDLVLNPRDVASAGQLIAHAMSERTRLYQVFLDARNRFEAASAL